MPLDICEMLDGSAWKRVRIEQVVYHGLTGPCRCPDCRAPMQLEPNGFSPSDSCTCHQKPH